MTRYMNSINEGLGSMGAVSDQLPKPVPAQMISTSSSGILSIILIYIIGGLILYVFSKPLSRILTFDISNE